VATISKSQPLTSVSIQDCTLRVPDKTTREKDNVVYWKTKRKIKNDLKTTALFPYEQ